MATLYAEATGGELALVGPAWRYVMSDQAAPPGARDLWAEDGSHPSPTGSYLAACVLYGQIYHRSPVGLDFHAGLPKEIAFYLQQVAETVGAAVPP